MFHAVRHHSISFKRVGPPLPPLPAPPWTSSVNSPLHLRLSSFLPSSAGWTDGRECGPVVRLSEPFSPFLNALFHFLYSRASTALHCQPGRRSSSLHSPLSLSSIGLPSALSLFPKKRRAQSSTELSRFSDSICRHLTIKYTAR